MAENKARSTRFTPETDERLQTVVDSLNVSKAEYIREATKEKLSSDYDDLSDEDRIMAEVTELQRSVEGDEVAESDESDDSGIKSPLEVVKFMAP